MQKACLASLHDCSRFGGLSPYLSPAIFLPRSLCDFRTPALSLANDSVYGLCAYFATRDYARLLRVAEKLEYGIVGANSGIISAANVPFGGVKESGYGFEGGSFGIDEYLDTKYVLVGNAGV